tara:strand:+ start:3467 stop:4438 length:972 start_codon:yes stop_codon:yes gene_type:complete
MNICFLDNNPISYDQTHLESNTIRGAEKSLINLALEFEKLGHKITVLNNIETNKTYRNIRWININYYNENINFDVAITNNDLNNFDKIKSHKKIAISHSIQSIEKFIRKKQLIAYLKYRPKIFLLGNYHKKKRSYLLRMFGSDIISWSVDNIFINTKLQNVDPYKAIFTSYVDRNLDLLISIWINYIFQKNNKLKLYVTPNNKDNTKFNIYNRNFGTQKELINDLITSKVFLVPGHKAELFCIAAEEARELCIPTVTLGIGSLSERIIHNKTGFIAKDENEFSNYTLELFSDINIWNEIRNNLLSMRNKKNWKIIAEDIYKKI